MQKIWQKEARLTVRAQMSVKSQDKEHANLIPVAVVNSHRMLHIRRLLPLSGLGFLPSRESVMLVKPLLWLVLLLAS